jgi:hypothetical protein
MKIDFIICGTQKGGTTALDSYLREHPQICMANEKEVHFFDREKIFLKKNPDYSLYHAGFNLKPSHQIIGEATPIYMYWYEAPKRIWQYNPNMKLIVLLRNPIERAYSHWNMEKSRNIENMSFWDAIINESARCRKVLPYQHRIYSYTDRGFYLEQLRRLWFYFSKQNVLIMKTEYLKNQPNQALNQVCNFIGIDCFEREILPREVFSLSYSSRITLKEKKYLKSLFEDEIKSLEKVLKWDCSNWLL